MYIKHISFVHSPIRGQLKVFPCLSYCERCCRDHEGVQLSLPVSVFISIYTIISLFLFFFPYFWFIWVFSTSSLRGAGQDNVKGYITVTFLNLVFIYIFIFHVKFTTMKQDWFLFRIHCQEHVVNTLVIWLQTMVLFPCYFSLSILSIGYRKSKCSIK